MVRLGIAAKYVKYLVILAVLLPLIFIAEVVYVERQQANSIGQVQTEELAKLRTQAAGVWLSSQASYVRGIAKLSTVTAGEPESMAAELRSFVAAETGFLALGYAGSDGKVQVDTSGSIDRNIGENNYFKEAAAGREYMGQAPGTEWQQGEAVTILAMPVIVHGEITGVMYGVIRQDTVNTMSTKLTGQVAFAKPELNRWLAWLGGVYLLGVIPLLLLVYFSRRSQSENTPMPEKLIDQYQPEVFAKQSGPNIEQVSTNAHADLIAALKQEIAVASKRTVIEEPSYPAVSQPAANTKQPAKNFDLTPAAVIDKALAARAYKTACQTPGQEPAAPINQLTANLPDKKPIINSVMSETLHSPESTTANNEVIPVQPALDALTGLHSHDEFKKIMAARKGQPDMIMLTLSIDGMKVINDFLGKKAGDAIVVATADIIKAMAGPGCVAGRFDGDKFILFLTGASPDMLDDIKKDVKYYIDLHNLRNPQLPLSITIGAAVAAPGEDLPEVWRRAERDMESHKAINRVEARKFIMWSMKRNRGRQSLD